MPAVRSCQVHPSEGDTVATERGWPSTRHDLFGVLDKFYPRKMDTLHGFTRPSFLSPLYHSVVRRFAGYGDLPKATDLSFLPAEKMKKDILIVGAGIAGRTAYKEIERFAGADSILFVDSGTDPCIGDWDDEGHREIVRTMSLTYLPPPDNDSFHALTYRDGGSAAEITSQAVVVCTGAHDAFLLFPNNDLPGVLTGEGALSLARSEDGAPFSKALLFGGGRRAAEILALLRNHVGAVASYAEVSPQLSSEAGALKIPVYPDQLAMGARGRGRVKEVVLKDLKSGEVRGISADAIILVHRRVPQTNVLFQAGAQMVWRSGGSPTIRTLD